MTRYRSWSAAALARPGFAGTRVGYLDSGLTGSLESIVLGAEQIRWVRQFPGGVEVSRETLAVETVADVGPGKQFLDHDHTLKINKCPTKSKLFPYDYQRVARNG